MSGKRVLVTGGAGFLGSHLCDRLLKEGASVVCLDNFMTGQEANIAHLKGNPAFSVVRHDVANSVDCVFNDKVGEVAASFADPSLQSSPSATPSAGDSPQRCHRHPDPGTPHVEQPHIIEEIYNLACPASPVHYQKDPVRTLKTSVWGALNMLELARRTGAKVLQASTSEVYGDAILSPQPESYHGNVNPIGIRACYDEGKRAAETLFFDYRRMYGTRIKVVRIFNTYGPRMHPADGRVVSNFIMQALRGEDITIYGDGRQTRSFCYVDDLIEAVCRMMRSREDLAGPVNIGNPGEFTIGELAEKVLSLTGSRSKLVFKPLPQDDPKQRKPDIGLAKAELGWEPRVPLDEGLKMTIDWFKRAM